MYLTITVHCSNCFDRFLADGGQAFMPDFLKRKWTVILWGNIRTFQLKKLIGDWVASGKKQTSNCLAIVV
jgi:hypothetical protein